VHPREKAWTQRNCEPDWKEQREDGQRSISARDDAGAARSTIAPNAFWPTVLLVSQNRPRVPSAANLRQEGAMNTDQFVSDQNLERFRKLADAVTTASERKTLLALLAEEQARFIERQRFRAPAC
jgi:hypothetical protein